MAKVPAPLPYPPNMSVEDEVELAQTHYHWNEEVGKRAAWGRLLKGLVDEGDWIWSSAAARVQALGEPEPNSPASNRDRVTKLQASEVEPQTGHEFHIRTLGMTF